MAESQPPQIVEGATTGDIEDEIASAPKSAEDRKAAAALSSLDGRDEESGSTKNIDLDAVKKAMDRLTVSNGVGAKKSATENKEMKKAVKVDQADVTLLVQELELSKPKATELLKAHDGDLLKSLHAYITAWPKA